MDWRAAKAAGPQSGAQLIHGSVQQLAPNATTFTQADNLGTLQNQQTTKTKAPASSGSVLETAVSWAGSVAGTVAGMAGTAIGYVAKSTADMVTSPIRFVDNSIRMANISSSVDANNKLRENNDAKWNKLVDDYKQGRLTKAQYQDGMRELIKEADSISKEANKNAQSAEDTATEQVQNAIDLGSAVVTAVVTIATAGAGDAVIAPLAIGRTAAVDAAEATAPNLIRFFGTREVSDQLYAGATKVDSIINSIANSINKVSTFNGKFADAQIVKIANETALQGAENLTAKQIAKNVAVTVLIKKPIIYNTNVGLVADIYKDIAKGDLSGAALTSVLTAGMAVSGGPIGWALKQGGNGLKLLKSLSTISGRNTAEQLARENAENIANGTAAKYSEEMIANMRASKESGQSFIDNLSTFLGDGSDSGRIARYLQGELDKGNVRPYELMKVMEETNMKMAHGDANRAAKLVIDFWNGLDGGKALSEVSDEDFVNNMIKWAADDQALHAELIAGGMARAEANKVVVGRFNDSDLKLVTDKILEADKKLGIEEGTKLTPEIAQKLQDARIQALNDAVEYYGRTAGWANSETFITSVDNAIRTATDSASLTKEIAKLRKHVGKLYDGPVKLSAELEAQMTKNGHIPIMVKEAYTPHVSFNEIKDKTLKTAYKSQTTSNVFEEAVKPVPVLQSFTAFLSKIGLAPQEAQDQVYTLFKNNFADLVESSPGIKSGLLHDMNGAQIMSKLNATIRDINAETISRKIVDPRQLTVKEVIRALDCTTAQAKQVMKSLNSAMLNVPMALRGLGDKLQDINMAFNPIAAQFARTQGALRYTYNPFFRWQQAYQTEAFVQMEAGIEGLVKPIQIPLLNRVNKVVFKEFSETNDETIRLLKANNIFAQGFSGEASGYALGRVGTGITSTEQKSLAGLVQLQARNAGMDVSTYIANNADEVTDTLRMLTIHNKNQNWTDSPLARTINTVFFPFRYNMKTAALMAEYIGKQSAPTQVAIVASYMKANQWLNSDEGIAWQTKNTEAIKLFNWLSPTYPLSYVLKLGQDIVDPANASVGDLGMLGGLPFGMISQLLEANGLITTSTPYVNPKTGEVYPDYVPKTARAEVNLAIQDFIGAIWSYPGTIIGLPSKGSILRGAANAITGTQSGDFEQVDQTGNLTPAQKRQKEVIDRTNGTGSSSPATSTSPTQPQPQAAPTVIPEPSFNVAPRTKTGTTAKKKKKSEFRPTPL